MRRSSAEIEIERPRPIADREPRLRGRALAHALALLAGKPARLRRRGAQLVEGDELDVTPPELR
jgi:hypothetical protein